MAAIAPTMLAQRAMTAQESPSRTAADAVPRGMRAASYRPHPRQLHTTSGFTILGAIGAAAAAAAVRAASKARHRSTLAGQERNAAPYLAESGGSRNSRVELVGRRGEALMPWKIPNTTRYQWLSVRELLLRERILMVTEYIDDNVANAYLAMLLYLQSEDATKPLQIYFSTPGADLTPALAFYDTIEQLKAKGCKVTTVAYSLCNGIGALLAACGSEGRRFATPNSLFLMTQTGLASPVQGQASDIELETRQMLKDCLRVEQAFSTITKKPLETIQKDLQRNFYLSAEEAVEYGLIDKVLVANPNKGAILDQGERDPWSGQVVKKTVGFGEFADPNQPRTAV
mmetsp:Transcript_50143/g.119368  ORF Transcript_50143/g.119368 Transcript_50143/m.119368 type:complete len:343 (-) Transcript_50143:49-1077(-)